MKRAQIVMRLCAVLPALSLLAATGTVSYEYYRRASLRSELTRTEADLAKYQHIYDVLHGMRKHS